jgi:beta-lactamase superfamily II metal-dependent hydrolase
MIFIKKYYKSLIITALFLAVIFIWQAVYLENPNKTLTVAFLDVGQGDSIYIESPTHQQMIIDGGPNGTILSEIGKLMPWYDHYIDVILITHSDSDHYAGFIDLLRRYDVGLVIESGVAGTSPSYKVFEDIISQKNIKKVIARRGQSVKLTDDIHFDVLFPDRDVAKLNVNDASIIGQLVYGSSTIMFMGDAPIETEEYVLLLDGPRVKSDILKVGHHGSKTSALEPFFSAVAPQYAVISAGLNNRFGHPNQETLDIFQKLGVKTLITFNLGTIIFKSGGRLWVQN